MKEPLIIAQQLSIPVFVVFDGDGDKVKAKDIHENDNRVLLKLLGGDEDQPFPSDAVWSDHFVQWPNNIGHYLRKECGEAEWDKEYNCVHQELGNPGGSFQKNSAHIGLHIGRLHKAGKCPPSLIKLCDRVIEFCLNA